MNFPAFIIHLERAHERLQNISIQSEKLHSYNINTQIVQAIDAKNTQELINFAIGRELTHESDNLADLQMSPSEFACYFSHYKTLQQIDNSEVACDIAFIFEDDFNFVQENEIFFQYFLQHYQHFDFDLCFLGSLTNYKGTHVNHFFTQVHSDYNTPFYGAHAYAVKIQSIPKILQLLKHVTRQYDGQIYTISCQHIKTFVTHVNIFEQKNTLPSNIRSQNFQQYS